VELPYEGSNSTEASASGISVLAAWANAQDHWVRALVAEMIETRRSLSEGRVAHFSDLLLRETTRQVPAKGLTSLRGTSGACAPFVLRHARLRLVYSRNRRSKLLMLF